MSRLTRPWLVNCCRCVRTCWTWPYTLRSTPTSSLTCVTRYDDWDRSWTNRPSSSSRSRNMALVPPLPQVIALSVRQCCIRAFRWYRNWWPWMTLNSVIAGILDWYLWGQLRHKVLKLHPYFCNKDVAPRILYDIVWYMVISSEITEKQCVKKGIPTRKQKFDQYCTISWKWCKIGCNLILFINRKSRMQHCCSHLRSSLLQYVTLENYFWWPK